MIRFVPSSAALAAALTLATAAPAAAQPAAAQPAALPPAAAPPQAQPASSGEVDRRFGISALAGLFLPGTITIGDTDWDTGTGFNLRAAADFFVSPRLSMGVYLQHASATLDELDVDVSLTAIGGQLVGRFGPTSRGHFRAGVGLAYQMLSTDAGTDDATGFGISPFLEYVYPVGQGSWFAHLGFNAQPSGGNADVDVTWGPIFTLAIGAEFGQ